MGLISFLRGNKKKEGIYLPRSASKQAASAKHIIDRHFKYGEAIKVNYAKRERNPAALRMAIEACEKQIAMGPEAMDALKIWHEDAQRRLKQFNPEDQPMPFTYPSHAGYKQLAIIREKEENYAEVIRLCKKAKAEGWAGDWDKRITRCEKRLSPST